MMGATVSPQVFNWSSKYSLSLFLWCSCVTRLQNYIKLNWITKFSFLQNKIYSHLHAWSVLCYLPDKCSAYSLTLLPISSKDGMQFGKPLTTYDGMTVRHDLGPLESLAISSHSTLNFLTTSWLMPHSPYRIPTVSDTFRSLSEFQITEFTNTWLRLRSINHISHGVWISVAPAWELRKYAEQHLSRDIQDCRPIRRNVENMVEVFAVVLRSNVENR